VRSPCGFSFPCLACSFSLRRRASLFPPHRTDGLDILPEISGGPFLSGSPCALFLVHKNIFPVLRSQFFTRYDNFSFFFQSDLHHVKHSFSSLSVPPGEDFFELKPILLFSHLSAPYDIEDPSPLSRTLREFFHLDGAAAFPLASSFRPLSSIELPPPDMSTFFLR